MNDSPNPFGQPNPQPNPVQPNGSTNPVNPTNPFGGPQSAAPVTPVVPTTSATPTMSSTSMPSATSTAPAGTTAPFDTQSGVNAAPTSSAFPATPASSTTPVAPAPTNKPKSKIKFIVGGIIAAIVIVVAVVLMILVTSKPSAKDYEAAYEHIKTMTNDTRSAVSGISSATTQAEIEENADKVIDAIDSAQASIDELGKMPAIAKDEEAKRLYDDWKAKLDDVSKETEEVVTKLKQIAPVVEALNKFNTIDTTTASGIEEGINAFDELAKVASSTEVDDKDLSEALDKIENASRTLTTAYRAALSGGAVDSSSMYDALSDLNDAQRTFNKTFSSTSNMVSLGNEADDAQFELVNYLIDRKEILEN